MFCVSGYINSNSSDRLPAFAVVDESVKIAKIIHPDKSALVNAILRNYLRRGQKITFPSIKNNPAEYIAAFHSHPLWLVKKWINIFGPKEAISLCSANNENPAFDGACQYAEDFQTRVCAKAHGCRFYGNAYKILAGWHYFDRFSWGHSKH